MYSELRKDIKDNAKNLEEKLERMENKIEQNTKSVVDLTGQIKELSTKTLEPGKPMQHLKVKTQGLKKTTKKTNRVKELKDLMRGLSKMR